MESRHGRVKNTLFGAEGGKWWSNWGASGKLKKRITMPPYAKQHGKRAGKVLREKNLRYNSAKL